MNYKLLLPIILLCSTFSISAEERWFEVELLLVQRNTGLDKLNEKLSSDALFVNTENSISMLKEDPAGTSNPVVITAQEFDNNGNNFKLLDSSHLQLTEQRKKLAAHAAFTPVLHMAWQMPVTSGNIARPIHLFAGNNLAITSQSGNKWAIDGNFKIYLDHYLFIDSQLIVRQKIIQAPIKVQPARHDNLNVIESQNGVEIIDLNTEPANFENKQRVVIEEMLFDQNRRLRSEEIHYLDHPLVGIIVQIRKIADK
ncbi:MAG TPA: peptidoglycan binding protein CsiV [Psychromonas sp.]